MKDTTPDPSRAGAPPRGSVGILACTSLEEWAAGYLPRIWLAAREAAPVLFRKGVSDPGPGRVPVSEGPKATMRLLDALLTHSVAAGVSFREDGDFATACAVRGVPYARLSPSILAACLKAIHTEPFADSPLPNLEIGGYLLADFDAAGDAMSGRTYREMAEILADAGRAQSLPVVWLLDSAERRQAGKFPSDGAIQVADRFEARTWLTLASNARVTVTDRLDVQIACCLMGVPSVIASEQTEIPEAIECGASLLAGLNPLDLRICVAVMARKLSKWDAPWADEQPASQFPTLRPV